MSPKVKKHKFRIVYDEVQPFINNGDDDGLNFVAEKYKLRSIAKDCLCVMLNEGRYIPELEVFYTRPGKFLFAIEKDISEYNIFKFLDDVPPYKKGYILAKLKSDETFNTYEHLGLVEKTTPDELNHLIINMYLGICKLQKQHDLDMKEALAHNDVGFFKSYFNNCTTERVVESLKREKFKPTQIKKILRLIDRLP